MSFDRFASEYANFAVVQARTAKRLAQFIEAQTVLDLGCGAGAVWNELIKKPQKFFGVDISGKMLEVHPKDKRINLINANFDDEIFWRDMKRVDLITSCGALQWSKNLDVLLDNIAKNCDNVALALFTDGTLKSVREITNQTSFLLSADKLQELMAIKFQNLDFKVVKYRLYFPEKKLAFKHLKLTGVHYGERLDYQGAKKLFNKYNLDYLEFEAAFCYAKTPCKASNWLFLNNFN